MGGVPRVRFRYHSAITVAAIVTMVGGASLAIAQPLLAPVLLIPLAVAVWAWRAGTDADPGGLRVRALLGSRHLPWDDVAEFVPAPGGRVAAILGDGTAVPLTAVTVGDLPRLVTASGRVAGRTP